MDKLAAWYGTDRSYVGRILKLAGLAPDIVEAIVTGYEPSGLSVAKLLKDLPVVWEKQRQALLLRSSDGVARAQEHSPGPPG